MAIETKVVDSDQLGTRERMYVREAIRGVVITTSHFFRNLLGTRDTNPQVVARTGPNLVSTVAYPEEKTAYSPTYRGLHRLVPRDDGRPRCVACYMCATVCPAQCIYIEAGEYQGEGIEKYPVRFEIDELRCIVCGFCVEACPKDAIRMDTGTHAPAVLDRSLAVFDKEALLTGQPVAHATDSITYGKPKAGEHTSGVRGGHDH